jgi:hypothetical protein
MAATATSPYTDIFMKYDKVMTFTKGNSIDDTTIGDGKSDLIAIENATGHQIALPDKYYTRKITEYMDFPRNLEEKEVKGSLDSSEEGKVYFIYYKLTADGRTDIGPHFKTFEDDFRRIVQVHTDDETLRQANPSFDRAKIHDYEITTKKKDDLLPRIDEITNYFKAIHEYFSEAPGVKIDGIEVEPFKVNNGLWKIKAPIYKLFDYLVREIPEIQKSMLTKSGTYNLVRWYDFVTAYIDGKSSTTTDLDTDRAKFFKDCKDKNVTDEQKRELYALQWYTRNSKDQSKFEKKVELIIDQKSRSGGAMETVIQLKNYKVNKLTSSSDATVTDEVYIDKDGKTVSIPSSGPWEQVYWENETVTENSEFSAFGDLTYVNTDLVRRKKPSSSGAPVQILHPTMYEHFIAVAPTTIKDSSGRIVAKQEYLNKTSGMAGGKRVIRKSRKQKRRSTRKRR